MKHVLLASALVGATSLGHATGFTLSSPDIQAGAMIAKSFEFNGFGCAGENKSPALKWSGAPKVHSRRFEGLYRPSDCHGDALQTVGHAIKFRTPADAMSYQATHRLPEGDYAIVGLLQWALDEAEVQAAEAWARRGVAS